METDKFQKEKEDRLSIISVKKAREAIGPETKRKESAKWTALMLKQATSIANKVKAEAN